MKLSQRTALIGHRGVGKTSLLKRIEKAYRSIGRRVRVFDLDQEIEQCANRSVSRIFQDDGEAVFRRLESTTFEKLEKEIARTVDDVVIAFGAGFDVSRIPSNWRAIWVRRSSDETGRVFTDRPRLDSKLHALDEFKTRSDERSPKFSARADDTLLMDEGAEAGEDAAEQDFFTDSIHDLGGALTVLPENYDRDFEAWTATRVKWGIRWFELRDDLLNEAQIRQAAKSLPRENILFSFRNELKEAASIELVRELSLPFDWPIERGDLKSRQCDASKLREPRVLSLHKPSGSLVESLERLTTMGQTSPGSLLKAALPTESFTDLQEGDRWQKQDPQARVFLPMSSDGRWSWFRLLRAPDFALNFFRETAGSSQDQPTFLQWLRRRRILRQATVESAAHFAAVLGDPVAHSRTPLEQADFFSKRGLSVFAIRMTEAEWADGAILVLTSMGLRAAAVTSPLKREAFHSVKRNGSADAITSQLESVNTLSFTTNDICRGTNTDLEGLKQAVGALSRDFANLRRVAVWGGGGTLDVIRGVFPHAQFFSARTGTPRDGAQAVAPDLVVWAAGLAGNSEVSPPTNWAPKIVFDLNYSESSSAREFAIAKQARYISGLSMFRAQAKAQREFWSGEKF